MRIPFDYLVYAELELFRDYCGRYKIYVELSTNLQKTETGTEAAQNELAHIVEG